MSAPQFRFNPLTNRLDLSDTAGGSSQPYPGGVSTWTDITAATQTMAPNNGYTADRAGSPVTFSLPATCGYGKIFRIVGKANGGWIIQANAGQVIHFGNQDTSSGGTLASTNQYDSVSLLCSADNTDFIVLDGAQGNLTFS